MGRKKAAGGVLQHNRPFCFFCDRTFDDETVLLQHQRAKHFRCPECDDGAVRGKCESVQGLIVHTLKVHGKSLARVPNAQQGRDNPELNVYGMDGIPAEVLKEKGFPEPGSAAEPPPKPRAPPVMPPGMPPGMAMPPGLLPPGVVPPPPGMMGGLPGMPALGFATGPTPIESGPSLEGFQKFLASQGLALPPGAMPPMPGMPGFPPMGGAAAAPPDGFGLAGGAPPAASPFPRAFQQLQGGVQQPQQQQQQQ
eukprot:CAMPEP_0179257852 /NCGR_PEP_ID=MMETSP0797-20121207/25006_1 /TAXON_ID=47934 /ORGANISM="Dinophysis acuminata, Strain DAEP01" /LENGTH=251 /DNA_ID=CAMNT_0020965851 /DNA_START=60 /DNA_END=812 /DNA_ORIENTATION=-